MRITWQELTLHPGDFDPTDLLAGWQWLLGDQYTPAVISTLGDLFLRDDDGAIHWLDAGFGKLSLAAESTEQFKAIMGTPEKANEWFVPQLIGDLITSGMVLKSRECYSYKKPPCLGGEIRLDNFEPCDLSVHLSILGQINEQVHNLPPGTPISEIKLD